MNENDGSDPIFQQLQQEARVARTARMLDENAKLTPSQRLDIIERCLKFINDTERAYRP